MTKKNRIVLFIVSFLLLIAVLYYWKGVPFPSDDVGILIFSALLMLSFVTLFIEHFFTKPTDVLSSTVSILLLLSPIRAKLDKLGVWFDIFYFYNVALAILSLTAILLLEADQSQSTLRNRVSHNLKGVAVAFGNGRFLFFTLFVLVLLFYVDSQSNYFLILFGYSLLILLIDPKKVIIQLTKKEKAHMNDIGEVFGVQSKITFLVKLYDKRVPVRIFDFVEFKYSMDETRSVLKGLILDNYLLNQEQWIKVLVTEEIKQLFKDRVFNDIQKENVVFKIENADPQDFLKKFIGVVTEDSTISKVRFIYSSNLEISDGQLLEINIRKRRILYQVVQGITQIEQLESKNETGYIVGEAIQLGVWNSDKRNFEKYGWVPDINSPVYFASPIEEVTLEKNEYLIGKIPNTNYPVIIDKIDAITHHMGILGVTGCGKSVFARNLIREIVKDGTKVICVDFTSEYIEKLKEIVPIVPQDKSEAIFNAIDAIATEMNEFPNNRDKKLLLKQEQIVADNFYDAIKSFLTSNKNLSVFELPDVSNTTGILEYTKSFFRSLFMIARKEKSFGKRVCVVLEEAHTVIPEWNFLGINDKVSQPLVNSIGQIALQGRKYNIGFVVIAQRTANVSKTVLTQCNSIVAFQEFDKTSSEFLSNYLGKEMVDALPNLKFRQAIAVGKGFKSNVPLIFEVPEIKE